MRRIDSSRLAERFVPFLKWPGGKRWLVCSYSDWMPTEFNTYVEPFLFGAGSVYFHVRPPSAVLGDINPELIAAYEAIKLDWRGLHNSLRYRQRKHREDANYYYWLRSRNPGDLTQRASRLIYLNQSQVHDFLLCSDFSKTCSPSDSRLRFFRSIKRSRADW